jgi:hypothetical protein
MCPSHVAKTPQWRQPKPIPMKAVALACQLTFSRAWPPSPRCVSPNPVSGEPPLAAHLGAASCFSASSQIRGTSSAHKGNLPSTSTAVQMRNLRRSASFHEGHSTLHIRVPLALLKDASSWRKLIAKPPEEQTHIRTTSQPAYRQAPSSISEWEALNQRVGSPRRRPQGRNDVKDAAVTRSSKPVWGFHLENKTPVWKGCNYTTMTPWRNTTPSASGVTIASPERQGFRSEHGTHSRAPSIPCWSHWAICSYSDREPRRLPIQSQIADRAWQAARGSTLELQTGAFVLYMPNAMLTWFPSLYLVTYSWKPYQD